MKTMYSYDDLKKQNKEIKTRLFLEGKWRPGKHHARRKPRKPEELQMFMQRAMDRMRKYPPRWLDDRTLVLPYFYDPEVK